MGNEYAPDRWVVIKFAGDTTHYRVLGTWFGGFATGDSWRINSGIVEVTESEGVYLFIGATESIYSCRKETYGTSIYTQGILDRLLSQTNPKGELMEEQTDWKTIDWNA